jgi:hypothetical protein
MTELPYLAANTGTRFRQRHTARTGGGFDTGRGIDGPVGAGPAR